MKEQTQTTGQFLPVSEAEMQARDWHYYDFLCITGDAYVDHPSFGFAVITRLLESRGYRVLVCAQPDVRSKQNPLAAYKKPRRAVLIAAGNVDSMVANYSVSKTRRKEDAYSPGGKPGNRPDDASITYTKLAKDAFPDTPVILGGLEASLRRFAHYDYWKEAVRPSILFESGADILVYGMGERAILDIAATFGKKGTIADMTDIPGICYKAASREDCPKDALEIAPFEKVRADKREYALAAKLQQREHGYTNTQPLLQRHEKDGYLVQNRAARPLSTAEFDAVYDLEYQRTYHPMYESAGGVPAISEVRFSVIQNRGCFGGCRFCSLAFHQGRVVSTRSDESILKEVGLLAQMPDFKGYIHDIGGPTANFRAPACKNQLQNGACKDRQCLTPEPCKALEVDHSKYNSLLKKAAAVKGVKKVFIRSGVRFDYLMLDKDDSFFRSLVERHTSGQLKVAPEHCVDHVLAYMGKPPFMVYRRFKEKFEAFNKKAGLKQYLVPYFISSHPGCKLEDALTLALYLKKEGVMPEQVQDFYPTPGTLATAAYYTGLDPLTLKPIFVAKEAGEKAMQRALLQWKLPQNKQLVQEALKTLKRYDLIGHGKECLISPEERGKNDAVHGTKNRNNKATRGQPNRRRNRH